MRLVRCLVGVLALNLLFAAVALASQQSVPVPQVNANLGPCTVDFTVSEKANQPLFNAEISVKIAYGFLGMKKMDLKVGTNNEGKARFVGLPEKVHNPPLAFVVRAKGLTKTVNYWPSVKCQARYAVVLDGR
ncbi:MAG: hypothetical protein M1423_08295 [Acidobacteria bacterium]|nr:hypothetical protein [Acidobacteriota bacterium]